MKNILLVISILCGVAHLISLDDTLLIIQFITLTGWAVIKECKSCK